MTTKKVPFGTKPSTKPAPPVSAEEWVKSREEGGTEPTKRLTIDIPLSLHRTIKVSCADRQTVMAEEIRVLLEAHDAKQG